VGGFDVIDTATVSTGKKVELPSLNSSGLTFYWVDSGDSRQVTYEYTASNGRSNRATATFNVKGLTGNLKMTPTTRTDGSGVQLTTNGSEVFLEKTGVSVPGVANPVGISFQSNATPSSGYNQSFTWVQILNNVQRKVIDPGVPPEDPQSGLDNFYPYGNATPTTTNDTPGTELLVTDGEFWQTFSATMYLMWDPALTNDPSGCTPALTDQKAKKSKQSTCMSIPIPLSSVTWHWSGCAINTLSPQTGVNGTTWILSRERECPKEPIGTVQLSDFPQWTIKVIP